MTYIHTNYKTRFSSGRGWGGRSRRNRNHNIFLIFKMPFNFKSRLGLGQRLGASKENVIWRVILIKKFSGFINATFYKFKSSNCYAHIRVVVKIHVWHSHAKNTIVQFSKLENFFLHEWAHPASAKWIAFPVPFYKMQFANGQTREELGRIGKSREDWGRIGKSSGKVNTYKCPKGGAGDFFSG